MKINTNTTARLIRALECVEYWNEALMDSRSERRDLILNKMLMPDEREHLMGVNSIVTAFIRKKLSDAQFEHVEAMSQAADRIAESVPVTVDRADPMSANDPVYDAYEGAQSE